MSRFLHFKYFKYVVHVLFVLFNRQKVNINCNSNVCFRLERHIDIYRSYDRRKTVMWGVLRSAARPPGFMQCLLPTLVSTGVYQMTFIYEGDTPLLVRSIQGGFRRYAVRKGSVRSTQKFCYIVRRHQFLH